MQHGGRHGQGLGSRRRRRGAWGRHGKRSGAGYGEGPGGGFGHHRADAAALIGHAGPKLIQRRPMMGAAPAEALGVKIEYPPPYSRADPKAWPGAALAHELD